MEECVLDLGKRQAPQLSDTVLDVLCEETSPEKGTGLLLIDMPTGYGKSYAGRHFIPEFLNNPANDKRCLFYLTAQKKNLPSRNGVVEAFQTSGYYDDAEAAVDKNVLWVESVVDMMINNAKPELADCMPKRIKKFYRKELLDAVQQYKKCCSNPDYDYLHDALEDNLRTKERAFRRFVMEQLSKETDDSGKKRLNTKQKLKLLQTSSKWKWLTKLYPTSMTRSYRVYIMSVSKFLVPNITLVENQFMFIDDRIIKNAVIIVDEFDASKTMLQNDIVERSVKGKVDTVSLVKQFYYEYEEGTLPEGMLRRPKNKSKKDPDAMRRIVNRNKSVLEDTFKSCSLNLNFKSEGDQKARDFIFYDHEYLTVTDETYNVITDEREKLNRIVPSKTAKEGTPLALTLGRLRGALHFTQGALAIIADNYQACKNENKERDEADYSLESAQRSVLDHFNIRGQAAEYFIMSGFNQPFQNKQKKESSLLSGDFSVYEQGLHYISLDNSDSHDFRTNIDIVALQDSPEKTILHLCGNALVIGMSATATFDSVLCNYDLDYLKRRLGPGYKTLSASSKELMKEAFEAQNANYEMIEIKVELIGCSDEEKPENDWYTLCGDIEAGRELRSIARRSQNQDAVDFNEKRYLRICMAYNYFLEHRDIASMICLTTPAPKKKSSAMNSDILFDLFRTLCKVKGLEDETADGGLVCLADSKNFEQRMEKPRNRLKSGKRAFVMASYNTVGKGVNIQYEVPQGADVVKLRERGGRLEKDFDAIYLDRPTHLAPYIDEEQLTEESLLDSLFRFAELAEHLEISTDTYRKGCKSLIAKFVPSKKNSSIWFPKLSNTPSVKVSAANTVNQALGRICRTGIKNQTIHILADAKLAQCMSLDADDNCLTSREYDALVMALKDSLKQPIEEDKLFYEDAAARASNRMNTKIRSLVQQSTWYKEDRQFWRELRQCVLTWPTAPDENVHPLILNSFAKLPQVASSYTFDEHGDYGKVTVSFDPKRSLSKTVSEDAARLPLLMEIPGIREYFASNDWAISWKSAQTIMTPVLFNNIYKGALGEEVGKYLLQKSFPGLTLCDIEAEDEFEKFDYRINDSNLYIDFKHWKGPRGALSTDQVQHVNEKMKAIGASGVLVINILGRATDGWDTCSYKEGSIMTVPYLFDIEKKEIHDAFFERIFAWLQQRNVL